MARLASTRKLACTSFSVEHHAMLQCYCHHGLRFADKGHMDVLMASISGACIPQRLKLSPYVVSLFKFELQSFGTR